MIRKGNEYHSPQIAIELGDSQTLKVVRGPEGVLA
jgi:hypothetical protein